MTSPGARYSAGTAILDVIPVFKGVQAAIERQVRDMERTLGKTAGEEYGKQFQEKASKAVGQALGTTKEQARKSGEEAGQEYGGRFADSFGKTMKAAQREFATIKFDYKFDDEALQKKFRSLKGDMDRLSKIEIGKNMDAGPAFREINRVSEKLRELQDSAGELNLRTNLGALAAEFEKFRERIEKDAGFKVDVEFNYERQLGAFERTVKARIDAALSNFSDIEVNADTTPAEQRLIRVRQQLNQLSNERIGIDIESSEALAEIERLRKELAEIANNKDYDIRVRTDAAVASAELLKTRELAKVVDGTKVNIDVDVDRDGRAAARIAGLGKAASGAGHNAQEGQSGFRAFSAIALGVAAGIPALIPLLGAVAGGIALLGPLALGAAAGLGTLVFAFAGIGDAVKAMGKVQDNAGKDAEAASKRITAASRTMESAQRSLDRARADGARAVSDANRAVSDAEEDATRAAEASARRVQDAKEAQTQAVQDAAERVQEALDAQKSAEEALGDAQDRVRDQQEALTQARIDAVEAQEDLALRVRDSVLDQRKAELDLVKKRRDLAKVISDGQGTMSNEDYTLKLSGAQLDVDRAVYDIDRAREATEDYAKEQEEFNRTGIEGSKGVVAARKGVADAEEGVRDAQERLAQTQTAVTRAMQDGAQAQVRAAREVSDAVAAQAQQQEASARTIADAIRARDDAQRDSAQAVDDAQRSLTDAQTDYQAALGETSASAQALEAAMAKLGPSGQEFATFLFGILPQLRDLRELVGAGLFPGLQEAISDILTTNGPLLATFMTNMGEVLGGLFKQFGDMMTSPQWMAIWETFNEYAPLFMQQFGDVALAMLTFFGELFRGLAPYAAQFGDALVNLAQGSADWIAAFVDSPEFQDIMEWLFTNGPKVAEFLWALVRAAANLFVALAPLGSLALDGLTNLLNFIGDMDPVLLGAIASALVGLFIAFQLGAGAVALFSNISVLTNPLGQVVFIVGAVAAALVVLYTHSETARDIIDNAFKVIGEAGKFLWEKFLKPAFDALVEGFSGIVSVITENWGSIQDFLLVAGSVLAGSLGLAIGVLDGLFSAVAPFIKGVLTIIKGALELIVGVIDVFAGLFTGDWSRMWDGIKNIAKGFLDIIWGLISGVFNTIVAFIKGFVEGVVNFFAWLYDVLVGHSIVPDLVKAIFGWFQKMAEWVWNVVEPFVNAIIAIFQFLWDGVEVIFGLWKAGWELLLDAFVWYWDNVLHPMFDAIGTVFGLLWDGMKVIFDLMGSAWDAALRGMVWVWDNILHPMFSALGEAAEGMRDIFGAAIDAIGVAWDKMKEFARAPINFVIGTVLNDGLIKAFNSVIETLKLPGDWKIAPLQEIGAPPPSVAGPSQSGRGGRSIALAAGGVVPGWSPNDVADNIDARLTAGEHVMPRKRVRDYGMDFLESLRHGLIDPRAARSLMPRPGFAEGGPVYQQVFSAVKKRFPRANLNSGYRPGASDLHGQGLAVDLGEQGFAGGAGRPYLAEMNRDLYDRAGKFLYELIYTGAGDDRADLKASQPLNYGQGINSQHRNHVHVGVKDIAGFLSAYGAGDGGGILGAAGNLLGGVWDSVTGVFDSIKNSITGPLQGLAGQDGGLPRLAAGVVKDLPSKMWSKISDSVTGLAGDIWGGATDAATWSVKTASNSFNWVVDKITGGDTMSKVQSAAAQRGWGTGAEWSALQWVINQESGGDPKAQNPTSTASGLFQQINSTWMANKPASSNARRMADASVEDQAIAGMNYFASRYGSPSKAKAFWEKNHYYAEGGPVEAPDAPTLYDTGGWLPPGITTVLNATTKPEPILTGQQWDELTAGRQGDAPAYNGPMMTAEFHGLDYDQAGEVWAEFNHGLRTLQAGGGGKYRTERVSG